MSGINLLPKDVRNIGPLTHIKHWTMRITTLVLSVYLVVMAGLVGWWLFLTTQDSLTIRAIAKAQSQIKQVSATEALVWEVGKRVELIQGVLASRTPLASKAATLLPAESLVIDGFTYSLTEAGVEVHVAQLSELEKYTERLKSSFPNVTNSSVTFDDKTAWMAGVSL